jgi:hypothetical protein
MARSMRSFGHPCNPTSSYGRVLQQRPTERDSLQLHRLQLCETQFISPAAAAPPRPTFTTPTTHSAHSTMVRATTLFAATAAFALNAHAESMYTKKSGVLSITGMDYDRLIAKSNYTSVSTVTRT